MAQQEARQETTKATIKAIVESIGGLSNIKKAWHCMTRLRFDLYDDALINKNEIDALPSILGSALQSDQFQIIVGTNVERYYDVLMQVLAESKGDNKQNNDSVKIASVDKRKGLISRLLDVVSGVFGPIVPAIAGAGMIKGMLSGLLALKLISATSDSVIVLNLIASGVFHFLPFFLAVSAAKIFKTNEYLAIAIAGGFMFPTLVDAAKLGEIAQFYFVGIPVPVINYSGTVIPIIISIWALSHIHKWVDRFMPEVLKVVFTPTLTLFVAIPFALIVIGPIGAYLGNGLAIIIRMLFEVSAVFAGLVVGAIRPVAVLTGMHHAMTPIALQNFAENGYDMLMPMMFMANMAIAGATLAIYFKEKNPMQKGVILSAAISGLLGITEPALFGVLTKYKKAFIAATIGSSVASAFIAFFGVRLYGYILSSIFSIPAYVGPYFVYLILGIIISIGVSFMITTVVVSSDLSQEN